MKTVKLLEAVAVWKTAYQEGAELLVSDIMADNMVRAGRATIVDHAPRPRQMYPEPPAVIL